jgi:hypothetical protein
VTSRKIGEPLNDRACRELELVRMKGPPTTSVVVGGP